MKKLITSLLFVTSTLGTSNAAFFEFTNLTDSPIVITNTDTGLAHSSAAHEKITFAHNPQATQTKLKFTILTEPKNPHAYCEIPVGTLNQSEGYTLTATDSDVTTIEDLTTGHRRHQITILLKDQQNHDLASHSCLYWTYDFYAHDHNYSN